MIKILLVLNQHAIFSYKDMKAFEDEPKKPIAIIPFKEIGSLVKSRVKTHVMLKSRSVAAMCGSSGQAQEHLYLMSVQFHTSYYETVQYIMNF